MRGGFILFGFIGLALGILPIAVHGPAAINIAMYETGPDTTIHLWPDKQLNPDGSPALDIYYTKSANPKSTVILICPGGGYRRRASHEGGDVAHYFNIYGYHSAVLQYRVAPNRWPGAYADGRKAFCVLKEHSFRGITHPKIAIMGFSAGGHLAATLATLPDLNLPDTLKAPIITNVEALILAYPVISFTNFAHEGSRLQLMGLNPKPDLIKLLSLEYQVKKGLCRTFIFHTQDDASVPVQNAEMFAEACRKSGVPCRLEVAPHGKHGVGLAQSDTALKYWPLQMIDWLENP